MARTIHGQKSMAVMTSRAEHRVTLFGELRKGSVCARIRLNTVANACALTRGLSKYHVFPHRVASHSSGGPRMAGRTGTNSLRLEDTNKPRALSCGALSCEIFAIPGKSYDEECPSWEELQGSSSEDRVTAIGPAMLPVQHSAISSRTGKMVC